MPGIFVEEAREFPTTWLSPVKHNDPSPFVTQGLEYYRSLAGSPVDSDSSSDSSSDCDDDAMSLGSSDLSSIREAPSSRDGYLVSEGLKALNIMEGNALGLVFLSQEDFIATEVVATSAPQAEGLRDPRNHQDGPGCGRPNQKHRAQQVYTALQPDGPTGDTLVREFPQDIGLWADVGDISGPNVFQGLCGSPFENVHSFDDGCDQPDTYDHYLQAPRMKTLALPEEMEYDEDLLYSGPDLGGWLTGTLDGVPKAMLPGLSCLDIGLSMPFAMED